MDDRVILKLYYLGHILLQTSERVKFVCENLLDIIIPFTLSFEELKDVICQKMHSQNLGEYHISVFGGFVQFQTKYVTDEASMQEIFSVYLESRSRISLYIEFEQSAEDLDIELEDYNSDGEEEFESNYEVVDSGVDEGQDDNTMATDVADVANVLANQHPFEEPTFMQLLNLEVMHAPEFSQYINTAEFPILTDGKFTMGMKFSSREAVIKAMKDYTILRESNFLIKFKAPYLQKLIVNIGYSRTRAAGNIQVSCFDKQNEVFEVREIPNGVEYAVDLHRQWCECSEFQVDRLPCRHLDWQLYVHDVYKMDQVRRVYRARFRPLGNPTTWPLYHGPRFVGNLFLRRVAKDRPRMTRFLNEMDTRILRGLRRCKQYGAEDHSHSRCHQRRGASAGPATQ
ncbi:hypothetical protein Ahy_B05g075529 [Arachis hypogaea]|uniref:SWIM-type domain-containing protein n=1 Tax=Arachis hypogaea TaxID=3818 RepID=A0A444Z1G0_ARAHY|nr:hypothetical protein Ahy_B05g075529 [Arachis hypogaea]